MGFCTATAKAGVKRQDMAATATQVHLRAFIVHRTMKAFCSHFINLLMSVNPSETHSSISGEEQIYDDRPPQEIELNKVT